jgi:hypothetical protein
MKKIVFHFAIVYVSIYVMAQKVTFLTQAGNANMANITQTSLISLDANAIYAVQSGIGNTMNSTQTGNSNYVELSQGGGSNQANMAQLATDVVAAPGGNNVADIHQGGISNTANLLQKELNATPANYSFDNNVSRAQQTGEDGHFNLNQGTVAWQPTNYSELYQSNTNNVADLNQTGLVSTSYITQIGAGNAADLDQSGASAFGSETSFSSQEGSGNLISVFQHDNPASEYAESYQDGIGNTTNIHQKSWGPQTVSALQEGTDIINVLQEN